jgi:hypothetical protein
MFSRHELDLDNLRCSIFVKVADCHKKVTWRLTSTKTQF